MRKSRGGKSQFSESGDRAALRNKPFNSAVWHSDAAAYKGGGVALVGEGAWDRSCRTGWEAPSRNPSGVIDVHDWVEARVELDGDLRRP